MNNHSIIRPLWEKAAKYIYIGFTVPRTLYTIMLQNEYIIQHFIIM